MKMRNISHVALAGLLLVTLNQAAFAGDTLDRVTKTGTLVEVVSQSYPPFSQLGANGEEEGYDIDVSKAIAAKLGVKLRVETPDWSVIESGNWFGRYDVCVCAISKTKDREKVLSFVRPYYFSHTNIIVNSDNQTIHGPADLTGKTVGVGVGSTNERYINKTLKIADDGAKPLIYPFNNVTAKIYDTEDIEYKDLALGTGKRVDALISAETVALGQIAKGGKFKIIEPPLFSDGGWVAVDHGSPAWEAKLAQIIDGLHQDGTLTKISLKWFGKDISSP
ncbi:amino acid ABC transporter substrate-binding protein [Erwinia endophytica]|uniref:transporter substrate-binding domain-containing protein n=1 Tax=Erwinia endophytica TaxID=1563158 RepID=UPI001265EB16|nr:transporter substrate-binding domain-containing protein [Erwinia endophytica]KAB8308015.1 amino acid ABC transporter substrate-binding protein [Erwinia endophytica]